MIYELKKSDSHPHYLLRWQLTDLSYNLLRDTSHDSSDKTNSNCNNIIIKHNYVISKASCIPVCYLLQKNVNLLAKEGTL